MQTAGKSRSRLRGALLAAACIALGLARGAPAADAPLIFAVFPYLSAQRLAAQFAPLRDQLQHASGREIVLQTAPDYRSFYERTRAGDYDIVVTAPHFGRLAEKESRYRYVAMTRYRIQAVIVVPVASPARKLSDLRGRTLAVPPSTALTHLLAAEVLRDAGLVTGRDVELREFKDNQNAMAAPLRGDADAGVTGVLIWRQEGHSGRMRVLAETRSVPGFVLMAHPRLPAALVERLRTAVFGFGETPEGQAYFAATGHGAWMPVDDQAIRGLDPLLPDFKR